MNGCEIRIALICSLLGIVLLATRHRSCALVAAIGGIIVLSWPLSGMETPTLPPPVWTNTRRHFAEEGFTSADKNKQTVVPVTPIGQPTPHPVDYDVRSMLQKIPMSATTDDLEEGAQPWQPNRGRPRGCSSTFTPVSYEPYPPLCRRNRGGGPVCYLDDAAAEMPGTDNERMEGVCTTRQRDGGCRNDRTGRRSCKDGGEVVPCAQMPRSTTGLDDDCGCRSSPASSACGCRHGCKCAASASPTNQRETDEAGHIVGDHAGHPSRRMILRPQPSSTADSSSGRRNGTNRLHRIVPDRSNQNYRDNTGRMSRYACLR